jgi:hypothetical protein
MQRSKGKTIDYLFEDPAVSGQRYALVSIVGPHMPQKCDTWGLKIRGVAGSLEEAKSTSKRIMSIDENYDIYTVEVGKFFPLAVEPHQVADVEYQNSQLNSLIKTYLENKRNANDMFNKRKNEMIEEAIREGQNQGELASRPEHPVAVLGRIRNFEEEIAKARQNLADLLADLNLAQEKFAGYTEEEREIANKEFRSALASAAEDTDVQEIDSQIHQETLDELNPMKSLDLTHKNLMESQVEKILDDLKKKENELEEASQLLSNMNEANSPNVYKRLRDTVKELNTEILELKGRLNNNDKINEFINAKYGGTPDLGEDPLTSSQQQ